MTVDVSSPVAWLRRNRSRGAADLLDLANDVSEEDDATSLRPLRTASPLTRGILLPSAAIHHPHDAIS